MSDLEKWQQHFRRIVFLIGGPDGLAPSYLVAAHQKWSLSKLTLPHPLVRIILVEQLYRAWSINHHPIPIIATMVLSLYKAIPFV